MIDSRKTRLSPLSSQNFTVQTGTIPNGLDSSKAKYPVNSAEISINQNTPILLVKPISISQDFTIGLTGDWNGKIQSGNSIQLQRGTINSEYIVRTLKYLPSDDVSTVSLSHKRDVVNLLDPYVSSTGYDLPANDTFVKLNRKVESPNTVKPLVRDFIVKLIQETDPLKFSVKASWLLDPSVSAAKIRWRSVPRVNSQTNLIFDIGSTQHIYKSVPKLNVISTTGRKAQIEMSGFINDVNIIDGGSGYTYANIEVVGGGGTGAEITANIVGDSIDSITITNVGSGYTSFPELIVTGPSGSGASLVVDSIVFDNIHIVQQGGNYLSAPTITIDIPTDDIISTGNIVAYTDLQNTGRVDYVRVVNSGSGYEDATVSIVGGVSNATAIPVIVNGEITDIKITYPGYGYFSTYTTISSSTGNGASAIANVDLYSKWVYTDINYLDKFVILNGFNYDIPYEIEILASEDSQFRGLIKYSNLSHFQISKSLLNNYFEYVPFGIFTQSPGIGEELLLEDMTDYSFQIVFNHNTFIDSAGIVVTLHSYADDTDTTYYVPGGSLPAINTQMSNVLKFDFSSYTLVPGDYYISFDGGILNDPSFNYQPDDWYFTVTA